jgi:hypothetical protein
MVDLWPKMYPAVSFVTMTKVLQRFTEFTNKPNKADPLWGYTLGTVDSVEYWKFYVDSTSNDVLRLTGDFAVRLVGAGVTECGVERIFSHVHWLVGIKRQKLSEQTLSDLASLKYGSF